MYKILILLLLVSVIGCQKKEVSINKDVLYLRMPSNPSILNPVISTDAYSSDVTTYIFDALITVDSALNVIPSVAKSWDISDDNKKFIFHLRNDVKFHDGVKLTSKDVKFTFDKIMDSTVRAENKKADFKDVKSVKAPNDTTFIVIYNKSFSPALLSWTISIIPKHIYGKGNFNTNSHNNKPIGSGPYKFVSWKTGQRIKLTRNDEYWGLKPKVKNLVYKIITEGNSARNAFIKDEIFVYGFEDAKKWKSFSENKKYKGKFNFYDYYTMGYSYIGWNEKSPFFKDKNVRRAMTFALNRKEILENIYINKGEICTGPFYPKSWAYNRDVKAIKFNLDSAKQCLKSAGWIDSNGDGVLDKDGKDFVFNILLTGSSKNGELILTILKENLSKIGVIMNIQKYEWATLLDRVHKRDFEAVILGWSLSIDPDPYMLFHSSQVDNGLNYYGYRNSEVDKLLEEGQQVFDKEKREKIYHKVHEIINNEQPYTFLFLRSNLVGVNSHIKNVSVSPLGLMGAYPGILEWEIE